MSRIGLLVFALLVAASSLGSPATSLGDERVTAPEGFEDELLSNVTDASALAFLPDGRLLVASRTGSIKVYTDGSLLETPALDISGVTCSGGERGLLGLAVDPDFADNNYLYIYYTFTKDGTCPSGSLENPVNRVSRFVFADDNVVDPDSETVLLDNLYSYQTVHNAGGLDFGPDGYLYVTVGDNYCDYLGDSGCAGGNDASRDQNVLIGKVLRITRDGDIPPDNPFLGDDSDRCGLTGGTEPGRRCQETYAWGLRNPFRFAFDPDSDESVLYINDVGQELWEEINLGQPGADYGWNVREGPCVNNSLDDCGPPPEGMTNPLFAYQHMDDIDCEVITDGAFVPDGVWPEEYDDVYLFADYACSRVFALRGDDAGGYEMEEFLVIDDVLGPFDLTFGPHDGGQALYYLSNYVDRGATELHRLTYVEPEVVLHEGWNLAEWTGATVGEDAIGVALDQAIDPKVWVSVAVYDGATWLQWFAEAPLPSFNTLTEVVNGAEVWIFVESEALFDPPD